MSDQYEYEYFDETGNQIDPQDLDGVDYEVVDEPAAAPQAGQPEPVPTASGDGGGSGISLGVIAAVIAVVMLVGGGAIYGLAWLGSDISAGKAVEDAQAGVETKKREVVDEVRPELDACDGTDIKKAAWVRGDSTPALQLKVVDSVSLPAGFADRTAAADDPTEETTIFQFGDRSLGIYDEDPKLKVAEGRWWKVTATTDPLVAVTGEAQGEGRDKDADTACESVAGGVYRVVGEGIPATSKEMQDGLVQVSVLKGDGVNPAIVWAVAGDRLLKTTLEYTPDTEEE